jgi:ubiquinone/menaquinone biosynthesis C-methylase UbiE
MNNKLTKKEKSTINYYDKHAKEWNKRHKSGHLFDGQRKKLMTLVPEGKVLEIGVGPGRDAEVLIKHFGIENYVGIEPAEGLQRIALKRNQEAKIFKKSIYDLDFPEDYFNAFWASAVLIHIPKSKLENVLKKIKRAMKRGAYGYISMLEGNEDMEKSREGRYFSLWKKSEFEQRLKITGFEAVEYKKLTSESGSPWLTYIVIST